MNIKEKIQSFISSYANSGLKDVVESAVISCGAKMIYRSINRITQTALHKLAELKIKNDNETNPDKKAKRAIGIKLGSVCLKQIGEALIEGSNVLLEGIE